MKILVYGAKGWIGQQFIEILKKSNIQFCIGECRIDNNDDLKDELEKIQPTHVISLIGRTHGKVGDKEYTTIDYLEQDGKLYENIRDNLYSPILLSMLCTHLKIHYTYLGTGCIFKYDNEHPFEEEFNGFNEKSKPNFFGSSYSIVKGFTEQLMNMFGNNVLNLRIRMPITGTKNKRNFITKIVNYEKICSIKNSMTVLPELLPFVLEMMKNNETGTINLTNPGLISHNEILNLYKEIVDPSFTWKIFSQSEQREILAADRSNNYLETKRLENLFPQVKHIRESVRDCLINYKNTLPIEVNLLVTGGCGFIGSNFIN
jgi:3,5-epimerase/4-reductase